MYTQLTQTQSKPIPSMSVLEKRITAFLDGHPGSTAAAVALGIDTPYQSTYAKLIIMCQSGVLQRRRAGVSTTSLLGQWIFRVTE